MVTIIATTRIILKVESCSGDLYRFDFLVNLPKDRANAALKSLQLRLLEPGAVTTRRYVSWARGVLL